jgi:prefoldin subunit 5
MSGSPARDAASADILAAIDFIKERMATKDDVREIVRAEIAELVPGIVALELKPLRGQVKNIEDQLDVLAEQYANLKGVTKEIDDLRREVRVIKKHLGLSTEIAA